MVPGHHTSVSQQIQTESSGFGKVLLLLVWVVLGFLEATLFLSFSTVMKMRDYH